MTTEPITPERERDWVHWRSRALAAESDRTHLRAALADARREGAAEGWDEGYDAARRVGPYWDQTAKRWDYRDPEPNPHRADAIERGE